MPCEVGVHAAYGFDGEVASVRDVASSRDSHGGSSAAVLGAPFEAAGGFGAHRFSGGVRVLSRFRWCSGGECDRWCRRYRRFVEGVTVGNGFVPEHQSSFISGDDPFLVRGGRAINRFAFIVRECRECLPVEGDAKAGTVERRDPAGEFTEETVEEREDRHVQQGSAGFALVFVRAFLESGEDGMDAVDGVNLSAGVRLTG